METKGKRWEKLPERGRGVSYLETEMTQGIDDKNKAKILNRSPFKKLAAVDDVAELILFLISKGSYSIHGQNFIVDGGSTA